MGKNRASQTKKEPSFFALLHAWQKILREWLALLAQVTPLGRRNRKSRPWHIRVGKQAANVKLSPSEIDHLLQRHRDLQDVGDLANVAANFRLPESDFFADPRHIERLMRRILQASPPWLSISRVLAGGEDGNAKAGAETLWREQITHEIENVTLFIPADSWRDLPLSSLTMRPAKTLHEVWKANLLEQVSPPEVIVDRYSRGEILIPNRNATRQRLEFQPVERRMEIERRKSIPIAIETEGAEGRGGQLLYVLLDYSASMRGKNAVLALATIMATVRANMGSRETRYLFRRFAVKEEIFPPVMEPPLQARTLSEKDALLAEILKTNFNGGATHVNDALDIAVADIEHLRREESLEASILLVTDGQAVLLESTRLRVLGARVKVHTVMVNPAPNPELSALSESYSTLDIPIDTPETTTPLPIPLTQTDQPPSALL